MTEPRRASLSSPLHFAALAVLVVAWFCGLSYLPPAWGTCFDGECGFTAAEVALTFGVPLFFFALPVGLEVVVFEKSPRQAVADIGLTRVDARGLLTAALFLVPLLAFFPVLSWVAGAELSWRAHAGWLFAGAVFNNGLAEETMMRGFVFRHLREGRTFWRGAALSTLYFAGYHVPLVFSAGPALGVTAIVLAVPTGFVTAYLYERSRNSPWGPGLMHCLHNALVMLVVVPARLEVLAPVLYMSVSIVTSVVMLVVVWRSRAGATA